jgi:hypothetical protein
MRAAITIAFALSLGLPACDQDYAASNEGRETFMGTVRAAAAPSSGLSASASAAPSASAPAERAAPPAGSTPH